MGVMSQKSRSSTFVHALLFILVFVLVSCFLVSSPWGLFGAESSGHIEVDLNDAEWEAVVWLSADGTRAHGMAVRKRGIKDSKRRPYKTGATTPWGVCDSWSPESKGKYCLISECELSAKGKLRYRTYTHRDLFEALP
jgi:hypothetical protein